MFVEGRIKKKRNKPHASYAIPNFIMMQRLPIPKSKWSFNQGHCPNVTADSKKHFNKGKTEVWKAVGIGYKLISNLGKEMKHKSMNGGAGWEQGPQQPWKVKLFLCLSAISSVSNKLLSLICSCLSGEVQYNPFAHLCSLITSRLKGERKQEAGSRSLRDCTTEYLISSAHRCPSSHMELQSAIQCQGSLYCHQTCSCCSHQYASSQGKDTVSGSWPGQGQVHPAESHGEQLESRGGPEAPPVCFVWQIWAKPTGLQETWRMLHPWCLSWWSNHSWHLARASNFIFHHLFSKIPLLSISEGLQAPRAQGQSWR